MHKLNIEKAAILYDEIERNRLFVSNIPNPEDRSIMERNFVMAAEYKEKEADFQTSCKAGECPGSRDTGRWEVSGPPSTMPCPRSSVEALVDTMKAFEKSI
jgi:phosphoserine aminotransferase